MWLKNVDNFQIIKVQPQRVAQHLLDFFVNFSLALLIKVLLIKKSVYKSLLRPDEVNVDIDERFQEQLPLEKAENRQMLLTILRCV